MNLTRLLAGQLDGISMCGIFQEYVHNVLLRYPNINLK